MCGGGTPVLVVSPCIAGNLWGKHLVPGQAAAIQELARTLGDTLTWCCSSGKILEGQFSKGKKEALIWAVLHSSLLKCLPFCTHKCQSPGQSIHISPGTHSTLHSEDRILATKQWNLSLPVSPNILVVIKSIDEHYWLFSTTLRENAGTASLFWALRELVTRKALCSERFLVVIETTPLTTPFSWGGGISTVLLDWLSHGSSSPFLM